MESEYYLKSVSRSAHLLEWLRLECQLSIDALHPLPNDASFRRYFRIYHADSSYVVMDAPPEKETSTPFVRVANTLRQNGLNTPAILHANFEHGFLVLSDLGDATYLRSLNDQNVDALYKTALDALVQLQGIRQVTDHPVPSFSKDLMWQEWEWHKDWFIKKYADRSRIPNETALDACMQSIIASALNQPQVFMHRDFHSANLMLLPNQQVGILDFQDAFIGPLTYDLVSLLRDCYIDWPEDKVRTLAIYYWQRLQEKQGMTVDQATFLKWLDWMGVQRHLKALMTFSRKHIRDDQPRYLNYIPRTLNYIVAETKAYPELAPLNAYYAEMIA